MQSRLEQYLQQYFGYSQFRKGQREVVESILAGKDTLAILPTGAGKSLCYQLPAIMQPGLTVVVSPLIALMQDQVLSLQKRKIKAVQLHSDQTSDRQQEILTNLFANQYQLLYISPERLTQPAIQALFGRGTVRLLVVDEAHCASTWGHDFRQEYQNIQEIRKEFPHIPCVGLTATATLQTQEDIIKQLSLKDPMIFRDSFDRPNIFLKTLSCSEQQKKSELLSYMVHKKEERGIIYARSRKMVESTAQTLRNAGFRAAYYHAGMSATDRKTVLQAFLRGEVPIVCATIAFGMGIDKSDVRFVVHMDLPENLERYYQEIGRAGRDGEDSEALLLYSESDQKKIEYLQEKKGNTDQTLAQKLQLSIHYATTPLCKRQVLLAYFDEPSPSQCSACQSCITLGGQAIQKPPTPSAFLFNETSPQAVPESFTNQHVLFICSKIAQGKHSVFELSQLVSKQFRMVERTAERHIYDLKAKGILLSVQNIQSQVYLTDLGKDIICGMTHYTEIQNPQSVQPQTVLSHTESKKTPNAELLNQLNQLKLDLALDQPAIQYLPLFSDKMLITIATEKPCSEEALQNLVKLSEQEFELFGALIIGTVLAFCEQPVN